MAGSINIRAFNCLGQYTSSAGNRAYCYAELAMSSLAVAIAIASTHFAYPQRDGQAELAWVAWSNTKTVTHLSTNPAQRQVTSLMRPTMLPRGKATAGQWHVYPSGFYSKYKINCRQ